MTSLAEERAEQQRWSSRLRRPVPDYDRLVDNEFRSPDEQKAQSTRRLAAMLSFAAREVPYYRNRIRASDAGALRNDAMSVLAALPVLSKLDVMDAGPALRANRLPPGETVGNSWRSSGTTGRPITIAYSQRSALMFNLLAQRSSRWHRLDPSGIFAEMRIPSLLARGSDGKELVGDETDRRPCWRGMEHFTTGPYVAASVIAPAEHIVEWLRRERPDYLMTYSETLELIARASGNERPVDSLKAVVAISEQLTPSMRAYTERRFQTPVHQVYGLMEFGLVATRCDAGRYHVHSEHCLIEIVDESGQPCRAGQTGRVVITTLTNVVMPLIRYDTGDLAKAVSGPCPCNRTLPSLGDIVGRYSRIAFLPPQTMARVAAIRETIENMPIELALDLREFQIHQFADHRMELRFVARSALPDAFFEQLRAEWAKVTDQGHPALAMRRVDAIPRSPGGKTEVFTSDFLPARNEEPEDS
jgi:phenylacetate-CoA ligase